MKLKIVQEGWENYTGQIGIVNFIDGISEGDVPEFAAKRIAANFMVVDEDEVQFSPSKETLDFNSVPAPMVPDGRQEVQLPEVVVAVEPVIEPAIADSFPMPGPEEVAPTLAVEVPTVPGHSRASLEAVADAEGIAGLRAIADPLNIKGKAISDLIDSILAGQPGV